MPRLTEPAILAKFRHALSQWNCTGYITWKPIARRWVERNLQGVTTRAVGELMFLHFDGGGVIDQVCEARPEWSENRFHFDFRILIGAEEIYIETILNEDDPDDPTVHVVSIHEA